MEYLTFRAKIPSPQEDDCKNFTTNNENMARVLQDKFITILKLVQGIYWEKK